MKKLVASVTLLVIIACYVSSCERDDICDEGVQTTPSLLIEFYDRSDQTAPKTVSGLRYFVEGRDTIVANSVNSVRVPLRVDTTATKWGFIFYEPVTNGTRPNTDFLEFKYTTRQEYVSRACGYKVVYTLDETSVEQPNPVLTDRPGENRLWIFNYTVEDTLIENENEAHIKVYF